MRRRPVTVSSVRIMGPHSADPDLLVTTPTCADGFHVERGGPCSEIPRPRTQGTIVPADQCQPRRRNLKLRLDAAQTAHGDLTDPDRRAVAAPLTRIRADAPSPEVDVEAQALDAHASDAQ